VRLSETKFEAYKPAPAGEYVLKVAAAEAKQSKKGADMIELTAEIVRHVDGTDDFAGRQIRDYIITDGAFGGASMGKAKLEALGIDTSVDQDDEDVASDLLGREFRAKLTTEQAKDKDGEVVMQELGDGTEEPLVVNRIKRYVRPKNVVREETTGEDAGESAEA
jgi:hypothetical protein